MNVDTIGFAAALAAANETQLLGALVDEPRTAADHAQKLGLDPRATERVLDVLVAFGVAARDGERVGASAELARMIDAAPGGRANALALWAHVPAFLRTGQPFVRMDATREASYANVVGALGRMFAPSATELAGKLGAPTRVLDVACGSGVWGLAVAARHPGANVTGLDLPAVLDAFRARAAELGLADRIATIAGDVHEIAIPRTFDLVIAANVLRIETPERAKHIVQRAAAAVVPGGRLAIVDALSHGTPEREQSRSVYALHLGMRTEHGRVHPPAQIVQWMTEAGAHDVTDIVLAAGMGATGCLVGTVG